MLLFSYVSEGAHTLLSLGLLLPTVSLPYVLPVPRRPFPAALPADAPRAAPPVPSPPPPSRRKPKLPLRRGSAALLTAQSHSPAAQQNQFRDTGEKKNRTQPLPATTPICLYLHGRGKGRGKQGKAQVQPALTCSPPPSAAQRSEYFNPKGRWCLRGEVLAGCSQAGAGLRAAGRPPGMGAARPPAHSPAPAEVGAPPPLLLFLVLRGTARHGQPPGTRREKWVPVPSPAPTGCGSWLREEEEEEGGKEGGGREGRRQRRWGCCSGQGDITAQRPEPAASSVRGRLEEARGLFVPSQDPAVAIEKGSREQAACLAPLPPAVSPPPPP